MDNKDKSKLVKESVLKAIKTVYNTQLERAHSKSAKFVESFAENLYKNFCKDKASSCDLELAVQKVKEDGSGKEPGEWLLDIIIKENFKISDPDKKLSEANFTKHILWAVESESSTSIRKMAEDFGKLAVIEADNYVYLNGVDQKITDATNNVSAYIERRIETVKDIMDEIGDRFIGKSLYYGFWPKPGVNNWTEKQWETLDFESLKERVKLYKLVEENMELVEV